MAGPSQPSVTDEVWDDARVKSFLELEPSNKARQRTSTFSSKLIAACARMISPDSSRSMPKLVEISMQLTRKAGPFGISCRPIVMALSLPFCAPQALEKIEFVYK